MAMFEETKKTAVERSQQKLSQVETGDDDDGEAGSSLMGRVHGDDSSSDSIGPPIPQTSQRKLADEEEEDEDVIGPMPPPPAKKAGGDDDDDSEDEEEGPASQIPSSHEVLLSHGSRVVSALALDPSGARLVSGGYDYDVKFWDFAGMDTSLQSFRTLRPCECHQIRCLEYSPTGDMILVVAGNAQAKIIDRDGFEVMECIKGDQYIHDMANTKGHTAMLNAGCWHPKEREEFITCSNDCTVRVWNVKKPKKHKSLVRTKSKQGHKTVVSTCTYSRDGHYVTMACQDGSIQMWDRRKLFVNPAMMNRTAHMNGTDTSCLCYSYDGRTLASRGGDDTLKLWDLRQFKSPLCVAENLTNYFPMTDCVFSPSDQLVVTGVSVKKGEGSGQIIFFDRNTLQRVSSVDASDDSSVVRCLWHPKTNQLAVGLADGNVKILYDPDKSHRGAKLCVVKAKRKVQHVEMMISKNIITPYALPMFRVDRPSSTRKQEEKARKDPVQSHRPELPVSGPGAGGRLRAKGATLSQYVLQQLVVKNPDERDKDPRAAILRHAAEASENPYWVTPAYKK
ncbi:hypothetical protein NP493_624g01057 [Ridgeia piscesae]|uniref:WD repeat-containing protein 70 n=1 Tax=Ridgeia piscesae TaxID=27915 RepID=A0AAD9NQN1_RIDPI|nr:hypothetical protein NP493_624g01057 [Ridgeia piscesae]